MKHELPTLAELHAAPDIAFKNDALKKLVNAPIPVAWLRGGAPGVPADWKDLPIDKVEYLLDRIFQKWKVEVLDVKQIFNSVTVTVRLHYLDPVSLEWQFHDGVGAKSVQTDKGFSAADLAHIKDAAVQMALPSAKTYAIKDAADHIGELFGRSLNRKNVIQFTGSYNAEPTPNNNNNFTL